MNLKKFLFFLFLALFLLQSFCIPVLAEETLTFRYEITVDGKDAVEVVPGDTITVTLYLNRTDMDMPYTMYAMQDEIRYDSEFLELVPDSAWLSNGIASTDISVGKGLREFYMNYVSMSGGTQWQSKTRVGSFQLKVVGDSGVTTLTNEDFLVSLSDGSGSYKCEANTLTVILSTACTVKFETSGGTSIDSMTVIYGELLSRPATPVREGKRLVGWFKDIHLNEEWNFETDKVTGNMTLYAKWVDAEPEQSEEPDEPPTAVDDETFDYRPVLILTPVAVALPTGAYLIFRQLKKRSMNK